MYLSIKIEHLLSISDKYIGMHSRVENHAEEIPLQIISDADEEARQRAQLLQVFNQYAGAKGYLAKNDLRRMLRDHICDTLPHATADEILHLADTDKNGKLSFEEFHHLAITREDIISEYTLRYCKLIVAQPDTVDGVYEDRMRLCPPPIVMIVFSILEIAFFITDVVMTKEYEKKDFHLLGLEIDGPAAHMFIYDPSKRQQVWRFMTYMFVHVGITHLLRNVAVQILLGTALEIVHHWWRVALVYVAGVLAGSMGTSIFSPTVYLCGASGGVYALITAHIATIFINWKEMDYAIVQMFVFVIFCGTDLGTSVYKSYHDPEDAIGYVAHLCGGIAGLLVGTGVLRNLEKKPWEHKLMWFAVILYFILLLCGAAVHIFCPEYFTMREDGFVVQVVEIQQN